MEVGGLISSTVGRAPVFSTAWAGSGASAGAAGKGPAHYQPLVVYMQGAGCGAAAQSDCVAFVGGVAVEERWLVARGGVWRHVCACRPVLCLVGGVVGARSRVWEVGDLGNKGADEEMKREDSGAVATVERGVPRPAGVCRWATNLGNELIDPPNPFPSPTSTLSSVVSHMSLLVSLETPASPSNCFP